MAVEVYCGKERWVHEGEYKQFMEVYDAINDEFGDKEEPLYILANFRLPKCQVDVAILTKKGPVVIDLKSYVGAIKGSENGDWEVIVEDSPEPVKLKKNLFEQVAEQRYELGQKLVDLQGREEILQHVDSRSLKYLIQSWGYFENGSEYDIAQIGKSAWIWFDVLWKDKLIKKLKTFKEADYSLEEEDMVDIVKGLKLREYNFNENSEEIPSTAEEENVREDIQEALEGSIRSKNRVFPPWEEIKEFRTPLTEGEVALVRFLDNSLSEEWGIFVTPHLNGCRPDVVVLHPSVGVMIYEVKDWDLNSKEFKGKRFEELGNIPFKNPIDQVNHYKRKTIELIPSFAEEIDKNKKNFGLIKTSIYFHCAAGDSVREFLSSDSPCYIFGNDELEESNLKKILPDHGYSQGYMNEKWTKELLFWLKPPFHSREQAQPLTLYPHQKDHAEPLQGHFRIRGVVGSGKTLILAYRAAKLASEGMDVLVITFNITLLHYIRDIIARAPFDFRWDNITFIHFHGFCKDVLNELGVRSPPKESWFQEIASKVEYALKDAEERRKNVDYLKYDAILIDEGQDYEWEWYNLLCNFLRERDELVLVCDKKQNIYGTDLSWIETGMRNVKFRGPWRELKTVCRIPKKIGDVANRFAEEFGLDSQLEIEDYIQLKIYERYSKPHLVWKNMNPEDWLSEVWNSYELIKSEQLKSDEGHPSDVVILLPTNKKGMEAVGYFGEKGIEVNHVFENEYERRHHRNKKSFWTGDSRLKMSTIHSFKGWEAVHVILLIPEDWSSSPKWNSIIYTAMTRSRENLIVLNCSYHYYEFGSTLSDEWD